MLEPTIAGRELSLTRRYPFPRERVFAAWSDPVGISDWWGPRGFTTTTREMDFRSGGVWRFIMHGPDGTDYVNRVQYREVVPSERISYLHDSDGTSEMLPFEVDVRFREVETGTEMEFRMTFASPEVLAEVRKFGASEGLVDTLTRLEEKLSAA